MFARVKLEVPAMAPARVGALEATPGTPVPPVLPSPATEPATLAPADPDPEGTNCTFRNNSANKSVYPVELPATESASSSQCIALAAST